MLEIKNTMEMPTVASFNAIIYGPGGVGKTTMISTFPKPLLLDFENGAKFFKSRGISLDTIQFNHWPNTKDKIALKDAIEPYETIAIDPIGTAMTMLIDDQQAIAGRQYRTGNGGLTVAGWGEAKKQTINFVKWLIGTNKNVIIVAHVDEKEIDGVIEKEPFIPTKLKWDLINTVDVVAYFDTREFKNEKGGKEIKRFLNTMPGMGHVAKDRTGRLTGYLKPDWEFIKEKLENSIDPNAVKKENDAVKEPAQSNQPQTQQPVENKQENDFEFENPAPGYVPENSQNAVKPTNDAVNTQPAEQPQDNFDKLTVAQLTDVATALGKQIPANSKKADIINILRNN